MKGYGKLVTEQTGLLLFLSALFILYALLPVRSSSIDALASAYQVKEQTNLFSPHHLLYNFTGHIWVLLFSAAGFSDVLAALKIMNAFAAIISLGFLNSIMKIRGVLFYERVAWLMLAGFSWGVMRYATENETYIIPMVFSLAGSYYLAAYMACGRDRSLILSGLLSAIAILMHQIHFFWWLAILTGLIMKRMSGIKVLIFLLPSLIVPIAYGLVLIFEHETAISLGNYVGFIFSDFKEESVSLTVSLTGFILTPISLFRTFFQVHGYVFNMIRENILNLIPALLSVSLFTYSVITAVRKRSITRKKPADFFIKIHLMAFGFHLLIAFLSSGNAEFMVMLPFLSALVLSSLITINRRLLFAMSISLIVWNLSFGLIPLHSQSLRDDEMVTAYMTESAEKGQGVFVILEDKPIIENRLRYYSGIEADNILSIRDIEKEGFTGLIDSLLTTGTVLLTNCIDRPATISRASFFPQTGAGFFDDYSISRIDSVNSLTGRHYIHRIYER
jgi:hypothetical protein